jgi:hypothetical protein
MAIQETSIDRKGRSIPGFADNNLIETPILKMRGRAGRSGFRDWRNTLQGESLMGGNFRDITHRGL